MKVNEVEISTPYIPLKLVQAQVLCWEMCIALSVHQGRETALACECALSTIKALESFRSLF